MVKLILIVVTSFSLGVASNLFFKGKKLPVVIEEDRINENLPPQKRESPLPVTQTITEDNDLKLIKEELIECQTKLTRLSRPSQNDAIVEDFSEKKTKEKTSEAPSTLTQNDLMFFISSIEEKIQNKKTPNLKNFLEKRILKNPKLEYSMSDLVKKFTKPMKAIQGSFRGSIFNPKEQDLIEITLEVAMDKVVDDKEHSLLIGSYRLILSKNGSAYSDSHGNGDNHNIKAKEGSEDELFLDVNGEDFIQIFIPNSKPNELTGIFYVEGAPQGLVTLKRD